MQEDKKNQIIETLENYSILYDTQPLYDKSDTLNRSQHYYYSDQEFWGAFIRNPDFFWNRELTFYYAVAGNWVARVPGLYWLKESTEFRNVPNSAIELRSKSWVTYSPRGKSSKVMGGIGTFVLPPNDQGMTIMTISHSCNCSTGIPMLVSPNVIKYHNLSQGDLLTVTGVWRRMSLEWSSQFQTMNMLPRGYLVVNEPDHLQVEERNQPVEFHPCTIMEYSDNGGIYYDFVYCTTDSHQIDYRKKLESFFETYRKQNDRYGKYLLAADSTDPIFESLYNSPSDLLRSEPDGRSQLSLITERIQGLFSYKGETIQSLIQKIPRFYPTSQEIYALAIQVQVPGTELQISNPAKMAVQLIELCRRRNKLEVLIDQIIGNNYL